MPKISNPFTLNDLRPISLTCTLGKIIEKFVYSYFINDIDPHFDDSLFGCRSGRSNLHALVSLLHETIENVDKGNDVRWLLLDYEKAFDRFDHNIIIKKF